MQKDLFKKTVSIYIINAFNVKKVCCWGSHMVINWAHEILIHSILPGLSLDVYSKSQQVASAEQGD